VKLRRTSEQRIRSFPKLAGLLLSLWAPWSQADYSQHPGASAFIEQLAREQQMAPEQIASWLARAERQDSILEAIARPAERTKTWAEYRPIFVQPLRLERGLAFWRVHREALERAEREMGVPAELILAIIGVETHYGRITGSYRVLDALATLAFDYPPRAGFFRKELAQYLILMQELELPPESFKGSYAGAMGYGQFMPSSYRNYAKDFDGDGFADIWNNPVDAIGSVAHYFARHGWRPGAPVALRARAQQLSEAEWDRVWNRIDKPSKPVSHWRERGLEPILPLDKRHLAQPLKLEGVHGTEYWLGFHNFYVITRYNRSHLYAMATYHLSRELRQAMNNVSEKVEP